jgi:hypothetical protein
VFSQFRAIASLTVIAMALMACGGKTPVSTLEMEQSAFDDLADEVRAIVKDPNRTDEVLALVEQFEQEFAAFSALLADQRVETRALNANYDATREEFDDFLAANQERMTAARERVTDAHLALITATTPEEWDSLRKATSDAMGKLSNSLRSY